MEIQDILVEVRDPDLNRIGQIVPENLVGATFVTRFNNVGSWSLTLPYGDSLGELLRQPGYGIILTGPNNETILSGPTLSARLEQTQNNTDGNWLIEGSGDSILLTDRLAYPTPSTADVTAQTSGYDTRSGAAEAVIKEYVNVNLGPGAPSERLVTGLTIEADQARGGTVSANARFDQVQELIYNLAQVGGIGYQLKQSNTNLEFSVFEPTNRSDTIRMDIQNRQLTTSVYSYGTAKLTRAIVAGQGEAANRTFIERTNSDSLEAETSWNRRIERFIDARQADQTIELNTAGDEALVDEGKTIVEMSVTPSDETNMVYGVDWFLGDTVTVVANNIEATAVVTEVGINIGNDGVRIGATVGTPVGLEFESKLLAKVNQQDARISHLETTAEASTTGGGGGITEPVDSLQFDSTYTLGSDQVAELAWGQEHSTMEFKATDNVTVQIGQEQLIHVKNVSGSEIPDMRVVMFAGATGDHPTVDLAVSDGTNPPEYLVGITTEPIANEGMGFVTQFGFVNGVDTSAWPIGTLLYPDASNPGLLTSTKPSAPAWDVAIAAVTRQHAETGRILVRALPGLNVGDLHDMGITSVGNGELVVYNSVAGIWENQTLAEAGISAVGHTHSISDVTGLQTELDEKFVADAIFKAYGVDNSNTNDSLTFTTRPVIASPAINVGTFTSTSDTITVPQAGIYECTFSFYWESSVARSNVGVSWAINGTRQNEVSGSNYIRAATGHGEATTSMTTIYDLSANDQLQLRFAQLGAPGSINLIGSKSVMTVRRIG